MARPQTSRSRFGSSLSRLRGAQPRSEAQPNPADEAAPVSREAGESSPRRVGQAPAAAPTEPAAAPERTGGAPFARPPVRRARRGLGWRSRNAGAAAVGTLGSGVLLIARLILTVAVLIALLIALGIALRDVDANGRNTIVKGIHEGANFFAGSFTGLIAFNGHAKRAITVDWGIALVVYLLLGAWLAAIVRRVGRRGVSFEQTHRPAV